jgi:hypothetical protein
MSAAESPLGGETKMERLRNKGLAKKIKKTE